ncbi:MAG: ComEC/Rec2 family competence protein [Muribaculaceae bacterium]|nr:ComEC/Rec2 family competence protein [Muribaculaceae bacterium]
MRGITLILILVCQTAGVLAGYKTSIPAFWSVVPFAISFLLLLLTLFLKNRKQFILVNLLRECAIYALFFSVGLWGGAISRPSPGDISSGEYAFTGRVEDYSAVERGDKVLISVGSLTPVGESGERIQPRNIKALIYVDGSEGLTYNDEVQGVAEFYAPTFPSNYYNADYQNYLKSKHIMLSGRCEPDDLTVRKGGGSIISFFQNLRYDFESFIEKTPLERDTKAFLISFLLGDKSYLNSAERLTFSDAGVSHIFAVSGLHVSIVGMIVLYLLSLILHGPMRRWCFLLSIPIIWFYILMVGANPATCRAGVMLTLATVGLVLQRKTSPLRNLGIAAILVIAFFPRAIFDIGFQLSILCVGSILLVARPLNFINQRNHPRLYKVVGGIIITLSCTLAAWILCAYYFHRFSLMFIPLNLIAVPLLPCFIAVTLVYFASVAIGLPIAPLGWLLDKCVGWFFDTAHSLSSITLPFENLYPGIVSVNLWIVGLIFLALFIGNRRKLQLLPVSIGFMASAILLIPVVGATRPNGLIFQRTGGLTSIACYEKGKERIVSIEEGAKSLNLRGKSILLLSSAVVSPEVEKNMGNADVIVLRKGVKPNDEFFEKVGDNVLLITHPSLHWRVERNIIAECEKRNLRLHSLRYDGPLHLFED